MDISDGRLTKLIEAADYAYQRARVEVFDQLPPLTPIDPERLSVSQRDAFSNLIQAEAELASYRLERLGPIRAIDISDSWSLRERKDHPRLLSSAISAGSMRQHDTG